MLQMMKIRFLSDENLEDEWCNKVLIHIIFFFVCEILLPRHTPYMRHEQMGSNAKSEDGSSAVYVKICIASIAR